jgi:hypothetical protein
VVNFAGCHIFCTQCIRKGTWKSAIDEEDPCYICGQQRFLSWAPFPVSDETRKQAHNVHHTETDNPIRSMLHFFFYGLNKKFPSNAFSHNGGRFGKAALFSDNPPLFSTSFIVVL